MSDDGSDSAASDKSIEYIFEAEEYVSSEDPPREEWSSLDEVVGETNQKRILYNKGLYKPPSEELCTKYYTLSASSMLSHPYYCYPSLHDPGIMEALLHPEPTSIFPPDGQKMYLFYCDEMAQYPVRCFYKGLLEESIDLRYYCVNSPNVRAMAKALSLNSYVTYLNLTDSFLTNDACLHLGEMLESNVTLHELVLEGCRIGPDGLHSLLARISSNKTLKVLNLRGNQLKDAGMEYLAAAVFTGFPVEKINLSRNDISGTGAATLGTAFETHNDFTHIDLSWNNLQSLGTGSFLTKLSDNPVLEELDLSWNFLSGKVIGDALCAILSYCTALKTLILNNNRLIDIAVEILSNHLEYAQNLVTLDLSYNPLSRVAATKILRKMKLPVVKVKNLLMDNVVIDDAGMKAFKEVQALEFRQDTVITYGSFQGKYTPVGQDPRMLVLRRIDFVLKEPKKKKMKKEKKEKKVNFTDFILQLHKENYHVISLRELPHIMKLRHVTLENDLIEGLANSFPGPPEDGLRTIHIDLVVEYMSRLWPDRKLPDESDHKKKHKKMMRRRSSIKHKSGILELI